MLARRLTTILPAMILAEALATTRIHSASTLTSDRRDLPPSSRFVRPTILS